MSSTSVELELTGFIDAFSSNCKQSFLDANTAINCMAVLAYLLVQDLKPSFLMIVDGRQVL
jgi:hypothetical protein